MTNNKEAIKKAKKEARNQIHRLKEAGLLKQIIEDDGYEYFEEVIKFMIQEKWLLKLGERNVLCQKIKLEVIFIH